MITTFSWLSLLELISSTSDLFLKTEAILKDSGEVRKSKIQHDYEVIEKIDVQEKNVPAQLSLTNAPPLLLFGSKNGSPRQLFSKQWSSKTNVLQWWQLSGNMIHRRVHSATMPSASLLHPLATNRPSINDDIKRKNGKKIFRWAIRQIRIYQMEERNFHKLTKATKIIPEKLPAKSYKIL